MPLLVKVFFGLDIALVAVYLGNFAIGEPFWILTHLFDLNGEANIPAWYAAMQLFLIGTLWAAFYRFRAKTSDPARTAVMLMALIFWALSLDEIATIHEWLGHKSDFLLKGGNRSNTVFSQTGIWIFMLAPLFSVVVFYLMRSLRPGFLGQRRSLKKLILGFVIYVGSAAGMEILANFFDEGSAALAFQVAIEEFGEMAGATVLLWATLELLQIHPESVRRLFRSPGQV